MEIFLTGFMGAGKTTVGRVFAAEDGRAFVDLDAEVVKRSTATIPEIFRTHGEAWFRRAEHAALRATAGTGAVVATGGGTATFEGNRRWMSRHGIVVWIHPPFQEIVDRIGARGKTERPLFESEEQALELYRSRLPFYRLADLTLEVRSGETPAEVAAKLRLQIRERSCGT